MISKRNIFPLFFITIIVTTSLQAMDPQQQQGPAQDAQQAARQDGFKSAEERKAKVEEERQKFEREVGNIRGYTERAAIQQALKIGAEFIGHNLNTAFDELRTQKGWVTENESLSKEIILLDIEIRKKNNLLNDSTVETKKAEKAFLNSQDFNQRLQATLKYCKGQADSDCPQMLNDLFNELKELNRKAQN